MMASELSSTSMAELMQLGEVHIRIRQADTGPSCGVTVASVTDGKMVANMTAGVAGTDQTIAAAIIRTAENLLRELN